MLEYKIKNEREFKKFSYPINDTTYNNNSYSCFIITNDNNVILAQRKHGFYLSYLIIICDKKMELNRKKKKKIIECIKNLSLDEIMTLLSVIYKKNIVDLSVCFSTEELHDIEKVTDVYNILKNIQNIFDTNDSNFMYQFYKILFDFRDHYLRGSLINNISIHKNKTLILPGGKRDFTDKSNRDIILREVFEELNLEIDIETSKVLNKNLKIVKILSNDDIEPFMDCYTKDFVLDYYYYDKIFLIIINKSLEEIQENFVENSEVSALIFYEIKIDTTNNFTKKKLKEFLKDYKNNYYALR